MWQGSCGADGLVVRQEKNSGRIVAKLDFQRGPVDRVPVEARRRTGLQPAKGEAGRLETFGEGDRRAVSEPARRRPLVAEMDNSAKEGAGRDHDSLARENAAVRQLHSCNPAGAGEDARGFTLDHREIGRVADERLHGAPVEAAVGLGARALHGRPFAAVEDAELNPRRVRGLRH